MTHADLDRIVELEHAVWRALVSGDGAADGALLSEDFLGVYETGFGDRAEHVGQLAGGPTVGSYELSDLRLKGLGEGVVLLAYRAAFRRAGGEAPLEAMYVSSIWARQADGTWRNVFSQDTAEGNARPV